MKYVMSLSFDECIVILGVPCLKDQGEQCSIHENKCKSGNMKN